MFLFLFAVGGILVGVGDGIRGELAGNFRDQEEQRNIRGAGAVVGNGELHELAWAGRWRGAVVAQREEDQRLQGRGETRRSVHL